MKRKIHSFIRPSLTLLDNGKFFRKPFGWLYAMIAIFFLLTPAILVYSTIWWNNAYQNKLETQNLYQEILKPEYQKLKHTHDTLSQVVNKYGKEMNNAIDCLTKATKQADYYGEYASYGPEYQQIYENALDIKRQWDDAYKNATNQWEVVNAELDVIKPKYQSIKLRYQQAKTQYQAADDDFRLIDTFGTVYKKDEALSSKSIVGLILFSLMVLLVGALNFFLWWSRLLDLNDLIKVQDRFVATPVASHFIQTTGESLGLTVSIWGFLTSLIFFTCNLSMGQFGLNYTDLGVISIFLPIILGFLIAFVFRILSELLKVVVVIANSTKE